MTRDMVQRSAAPYPQLRAAAALAFQIPALGVQLSSGSLVRTVGTLVDGPDLVHPADFRELVATAMEARSLEAIYLGVDLPVGDAIDVRLFSRRNDCVARPGGVIRVDSTSGLLHVFATDLWWPDTLSVLLDQTEVAGILSARFGQIDPYLDVVQSITMNSVLDDAVDISLISVHHPYRAGAPTGAVAGISAGDVAGGDLVTIVTESIAHGVAERLFSLIVER